MRETISIALLGAAVACGIAHADGRIQRIELDNGLRVILNPIDGATRVALVLLFDIGDEHDPPGKSGMGHLIEHLYVTAAAADVPAQTAVDWMNRYGGQCNAQTGHDYTVVAVVFQSEKLDAELAESAARMSDLRFEQGDLDRELPRLEQELTNMYGGLPHLAAQNLAAAAADPVGRLGARKGGRMEHIASITVEELRGRHARYYKPANAILVLAGGFNAQEAKRQIEQRFGGIDGGEPTPDPQPAAPPMMGGVRSVTVAKPTFGRFPDAIATIAYRAPSPESDLYAPFLILVARLFVEAMPRIQQAAAQQLPVMPFYYPLFDMPNVLFVSREAAADEVGEDAVAPLRAQVAAATAFRQDAPVDTSFLRQNFGPMLGLTEVPVQMSRMNPYMLAFSLGRRVQLGIEPEALRAAIDGVTVEQLERCRQEVFGPDRGAAVVVRLE